jgi:hypothetical protein
MSEAADRTSAQDAHGRGDVGIFSTCKAYKGRM